MIRKFVLPLVALCGFLFAIYIVRADNQPTPVAVPVTAPAAAPFKAFITGAGLVEAASENIEISTPVAGLVRKVFVKVGDRVALGSPLFQLDDRKERAQIAVQEALLKAAEAKLAKMKVSPRAEDVPIGEAQVAEAAANVADLKAQLQLREKLADKRAVSEDEMSRRRYAITQAEAKLANTQAQLAELKAGSWAPDLEIAQADAAQVRAQLQASKTDLERLTIRAPADGECLQVKIHAGEYATTGNLSTPLILFGDTSHLRVRVDIDENDAWRVKGEARAVAYAQGEHSAGRDLNFVRFEPYVIPKVSLTGGTTERVDTRVLQIVYEFAREDRPIYPGQQMDVYIDELAVR